MKNYFMTYSGIDIFAEMDTKGGGITYTAIINGKPEDFSSLVDVKRVINLTKLREKSR